MLNIERQQIGNNDLRLSCDGASGFFHVVLFVPFALPAWNEDADDGDVIVVHEDDLEALRDKLTEIIAASKAGGCDA